MGGEDGVAQCLTVGDIAFNARFGLKFVNAKKKSNVLMRLKWHFQKGGVLVFSAGNISGKVMTIEKSLQNGS
jgi:hypothetical protein